MKVFIKKTVYGLLLVLASLTALTFVNRFLASNYFQVFKLPKNANKVILGDSHSTYALDDALLKNTENLSNNADSYFYSFLKLKQITAVNTNIDTIFISFSFHNFTKYTQNKWLLNPTHLSNRLEKYLPFMGLEDLYFSLKTSPGIFFESLFKQLKLPYYLYKSERKLYGGHRKLKHQMSSSEMRQAEKTYEDKNLERANFEIHFLKEMTKYCHTRPK
jgi:hypothetical protein